MIASSNNKLGNDSWSFNPLKGFILKKTVTHNITGFYECSVDEFSDDKLIRPSVFRVAVFQVEISGKRIQIIYIIILIMCFYLLFVC